MKAKEAAERGVKEKYVVAKAFKGKEENALATRIEDNPNDFGDPAERHPPKGHGKPNVENLTSHFKGLKVGDGKKAKGGKRK